MEKFTLKKTSVVVKMRLFSMTCSEVNDCSNMISSLTKALKGLCTSVLGVEKQVITYGVSTIKLLFE